MRVLHKRGIFVGLLALLILIFPVSGAGAEMIKITVPAYVEVSSSWITLGEIARISGVNGEEKERLAGIRVGRAMSPGYEKDIQKEYLSLLLQEKGYSQSSFEIVMASYKVTVRTASRTITGAEILEFVRGYLGNKVQYPAEQIRITPRFKPRDILIPDREYQLKIVQKREQELRGNLSLQVLVKIDNSVYKRVFVSFRVEVMEKVFAANRRINRGERIDRDDFHQVKRDTDSIQGALIRDFNDPLVREGIVSIAIPEGGILTDYYLKIPDIVSRGDVLTAEVIVGNVSVSTLVEAQGNGKKGEYILVENLKTGYRFQAEVINSHLVRMVRG